MADPDIVDVTSGPGPLAWHHRILGADRLDHTMRSGAVGEFLDLRDTFIAALLDDVSGAELTRHFLAVVVARHGDNPLGAQLLGCEHTHESDRIVADNRDGLARAVLTICRTTWGGVLVGLECGGELRSTIPAGPSVRERSAHFFAARGATMNILAAAV